MLKKNNNNSRLNIFNKSEFNFFLFFSKKRLKYNSNYFNFYIYNIFKSSSNVLFPFIKINFLRKKLVIVVSFSISVFKHAYTKKNIFFNKKYIKSFRPLNRLYGLYS